MWGFFFLAISEYIFHHHVSSTSVVKYKIEALSPSTVHQPKDFSGSSQHPQPPLGVEFQLGSSLSGVLREPGGREATRGWPGLPVLQVLQLAGTRAGGPVACAGPSAPPQPRTSASHAPAPRCLPPAEGVLQAPGAFALCAPAREGGVEGRPAADVGVKRPPWRRRQSREPAAEPEQHARPTGAAVSAAPQPSLWGRPEGAGRERAYAARRRDLPGQPVGFWGPRPARRARAQVVNGRRGPGLAGDSGAPRPPFRGVNCREGCPLCPRGVSSGLWAPGRPCPGPSGAGYEWETLAGCWAGVRGRESQDEKVGSRLPRGPCAPRDPEPRSGSAWRAC